MNRVARLLRLTSAARGRVVALCLAVLAAQSVSPAAAATAWTTDAAGSRLTFTATQAGAKFEGTFLRFEPTIEFDPADLAGSRFRVVVAMDSADTRDAERDETLKGGDFFAVKRWPAATFETSSFKALADSRYEAPGRLTIRDVSRPVRLVFTFVPSADGATATLAGGATLQRLDFGVGQGEWSDTAWIGNPVEVRFELRLAREP